MVQKIEGENGKKASELHITRLYCEIIGVFGLQLNFFVSYLPEVE